MKGTEASAAYGQTLTASPVFRHYYQFSLSVILDYFPWVKYICFCTFISLQRAHSNRDVQEPEDGRETTFGSLTQNQPTVDRAQSKLIEQVLMHYLNALWLVLFLGMWPKWKCKNNQGISGKILVATMRDKLNPPLSPPPTPTPPPKKSWNLK